MSRISFDSCRHPSGGDFFFPPQVNDLRETGQGSPLALTVLFTEAHETANAMFRISIVETLGQRRLILEGTLVRPWTSEVETAWKLAGRQLQGRKLIVDLTNVTLISADGENILFKLMRDGAKFSSGDVMTKHVLKQLARRCGHRT